MNYSDISKKMELENKKKEYKIRKEWIYLLNNVFENQKEKRILPNNYDNALKDLFDMNYSIKC
jgi:hypothetical protein